MILKINGHIINLDKPEKLTSILQKENFHVPLFCGGNGTCGKCLVHLKKGYLAVTDADRACLSEYQLAEGYRLACQAIIRADCELEVKTEEEKHFFIPENELYKQPELKSDVNYVIAIDIGTTTIAMAVAEQNSGVIVKQYTGLNHQRSYGTDVMARIKAANEGALYQLQKIIRYDLVTGLENIFLDFTGHISHIAIAGNTTMIHLLRGYTCTGLGAYPFSPVSLAEERLTTKEAFGELSKKLQYYIEETHVTILQGLSAFVGSDITAGILACGAASQNGENKRHNTVGAQLLLDLGTNAEMALWKDHQLWITSAAAGPAFEGGHLSCGTGSIEGAVSKVMINYGLVRFETIGHQPPIGICGSGLISAVSELVKAGWIDSQGTFRPRYAKQGMVIVPGKICISQGDIRAFQMAKAAVRAGLALLLETSETKASEILQFHIAGGFGSQLQPEQIAAIGLIPDSLSQRIVMQGNTVVAGVIRYLQNRTFDFSSMFEDTKEIVLANHTAFPKLYTKYMTVQKN